MFDLLGKSTFVSCIPESTLALLKLRNDSLSSYITLRHPITFDRISNICCD